MRHINCEHCQHTDEVGQFISAVILIGLAVFCWRRADNREASLRRHIVAIEHRQGGESESWGTFIWASELKDEKTK